MNIVERPDTAIVMLIYQSTFGGHRCEIALWRSPAAEIVAWALRVGVDGRLDPFVGGHGSVVREYAQTQEAALAAVKRRLVALLGDEGMESSVTFSTDPDRSAQPPVQHSSTPPK